jgi:hypothetical protein
MKIIATFLFVSTAIAISPSPSLADERLGDAALGALSGAVVLGPVGAAAGAVVGYAMGPSIARSLGIKKRKKGRRARAANRPKAGLKRVAAPRIVPMPPARPGVAQESTPIAQTAPPAAAQSDNVSSVQTEATSAAQMDGLSSVQAETLPPAQSLE